MGGGARDDRTQTWRRRRLAVGPSLAPQPLPVRAALGAAAVLALTAACSGGAAGGASGGKDCTIALSFLYSEIPVAESLKTYARNKAKTYGCDLRTDNITGGKVNDQIASVDNFISQGVDALVVQHLDPAPYNGLLERAHEANIPYVSYFVPIPGQDGSVQFEQAESAEAAEQGRGRLDQQERWRPSQGPADGAHE